MDTNEYYLKYLKYKNKYFKLKTLLENNSEQYGAGKKTFNNLF